MVSFFRILLTVLNVVFLIYGVNHIVFADDLSESSSMNQCLRRSVTSIQLTGVFISTVAIIGIVGACFRVRVLEYIYLFAILVSMVSIALFFVFLWSIMPVGTSYEVWGNRAEHGFWLPGYNTVMQKTLASGKQWDDIKGCFREIDTCRTMLNQTRDEKNFYVDMGCCIPPNRCGLEQASTGLWVPAAHGLNSTDSECKLFAQLGESCFECDSCKAGYLCNYHDEWEKGGTSRIECITMLVVTLIVAYYTTMHDHPLVHDKDPKHVKFVLSTNV